jgi:hypothetical protein
MANEFSGHIVRRLYRIAALEYENHKNSYKLVNKSPRFARGFIHKLHALRVPPCAATILTHSPHPNNRPSWVYNAFSVFWLSLVFYPVFPAALALDPGVVQWATDFYQKGAFCSVASISNLSIGTDRIVVTLNIDRRWAETLVLQQLCIDGFSKTRSA